MSDRLIATLKQILDKFDTGDSNVYYISSLVKSVLTCIEEDPETCPFKNDLVQEFIHLVKRMMKGKSHHNKPMMRHGRQLKTTNERKNERSNGEESDTKGMRERKNDRKNQGKS